MMTMFGTRSSSSCLAFSTVTKQFSHSRHTTISTSITSSSSSSKTQNSLILKRPFLVRLQSSSSSSSSNSNNNSDDKNRRNRMIEKSQKLSLAPMMDYTDRHFRHLIRLLSRHTLTYTEMITSNAIVHEYRNDGNRRVDGDEYLRRMLSSPSTDEPCILQLGGSDANQLQEACQIVQQYQNIASYTGINLNCGCPSPKVAGKGCFGAALMDEPQLVRDVTTAMSQGFSTSSSIMPVSVKCRIGTDIHNSQNDEEEYQTLCNFIETVSSPGIVKHFDIHARQAILTRNISPADNRHIPPLKYHYITDKLVHDFPHLTFSLNGGVVNLQQVLHLLDNTPSNMVGCMVGRAFAANPWHFSYADPLLYNNKEEEEEEVVVPCIENRFQLLQRYGKYADEEEERWGKLRTRRFLCRAIQNVFAGETNSKRYRIALDQHIAGSAKHDPTNTIPLSTMILEAATTHLSDDVLYATPEQSYHTWLDKQNNNNNNNNNNDKSIIGEWQTRRKEQEKQDKATFSSSPP